MFDNKIKHVKRNICDTCGTEIHPDTKLGCSICKEKYFDKIKESCNKSLERTNSLSKDLFAFYFDLSDEFVKGSYKIMSSIWKWKKSG
jgi:hypothetical protein